MRKFSLFTNVNEGKWAVDRRNGPLKPGTVIVLDHVVNYTFWFEGNEVRINMSDGGTIMLMGGDVKRFAEAMENEDV